MLTQKERRDAKRRGLQTELPSTAKRDLRIVPRGPKGEYPFSEYGYKDEAAALRDLGDDEVWNLYYGVTPTTPLQQKVEALKGKPSIVDVNKAPRGLIVAPQTEQIPFQTKSGEPAGAAYWRKYNAILTNPGPVPMPILAHEVQHAVDTVQASETPYSTHFAEYEGYPAFYSDEKKAGYPSEKPWNLWEAAMRAKMAGELNDAAMNTPEYRNRMNSLEDMLLWKYGIPKNPPLGGTE